MTHRRGGVGQEEWVRVVPVLGEEADQVRHRLSAPVPLPPSRGTACLCGCWDFPKPRTLDTQVPAPHLPSTPSTEEVLLCGTFPLLCWGHSRPKPARSTSEEAFPTYRPPPTKGLALGGWALAPLSVFILFAYLHINLTEFFEGKDHGSFISIFGPRGLKKKKKTL